MKSELDFCTLQKSLIENYKICCFSPFFSSNFFFQYQLVKMVFLLDWWEKNSTNCYSYSIVRISFECEPYIYGWHFYTVDYECCQRAKHKISNHVYGSDICVKFFFIFFFFSTMATNHSHWWFSTMQYVAFFCCWTKEKIYLHLRPKKTCIWIVFVFVLHVTLKTWMCTKCLDSGRVKIN